MSLRVVHILAERFLLCFFVVTLSYRFNLNAILAGQNPYIQLYVFFLSGIHTIQSIAFLQR